MMLIEITARLTIQPRLAGTRADWGWSNIDRGRHATFMVILHREAPVEDEIASWLE